MATATLASTTDADSSCLHSLQSLTAEIEAAIRAIASDELPRFTESVARQELLASSLRQSLGNQSSPAVLIASRELQLANLKYAALLKHSGRTIAMLTALCSSHRGHPQEAHRPRSKHQTWHCEM